MMILGIGNDLVDCRRIKRTIEHYGLRFITRVYTVQEQARMNKRVDFIAGYAKLFAMKEALLKALGTGLAKNIQWLDIEIFREVGLAPCAEFSGAAWQILCQQVPSGYKAEIHLSVSDEWPYAQAFAIISAKLFDIEGDNNYG